MSYQIWALGSNGNGQLGIGNHDDVSTPIQCLFNADGLRDTLKSRPLRTISGGNHTFLLTEDGCAYACGQNDDGRCGLKSQATVTSFEKVSFTAERPGNPPRVIDKFYHVAATWSSTMFVTWNEETRGTEIYSCGTGDYGELAQGAGITQSESPTFVAAFRERVNHMAASARHIVMVFEDGTIRGCGSGRHGQLGDVLAETTPAGAPPMSMWSLSKLSLPNDIHDGRPVKSYSIACGMRFTVILAHNTAGGPVTHERKIWLLGCDGKYDKFNLRQDIADAQIGLSHIAEVSSCWNTVHFNSRYSPIVSCGRGDKGQHAPAIRVPPWPVHNMKAGSEHVIAQSTIWVAVVIWGWGEHGNCGPVDAEGQLLGDKGYYMVEAKDLPGARGIWPLGAGCATTFIGSHNLEGYTTVLGVPVEGMTPEREYLYE